MLHILYVTYTSMSHTDPIKIVSRSEHDERNMNLGKTTNMKNIMETFGKLYQSLSLILVLFLELIFTNDD